MQPAREASAGGLAVGGTSHRRRDIQGMRAIAVLAVIVYHAGFGLPRGYLGVDVFFVISGFVITGTLLPDLFARDHVRVRAFYGRRIRRLLPALALMVVVVCVAGILLVPAGAQDAMGKTGFFASIFSANIHLYNASNDYFAVDTHENPLLHTWSLGVEEQFYILFPFVLLAGWWLFGRGRRAEHRGGLAVLLGLSTVLSLLAAEWISSGHRLFGHAFESPGLFTFYSLPTRVWQLGFGALLCVLAPRLAVRNRKIAIALRVIGLLAIAAVVATGGMSTKPAVTPVLAAGLVLVAGVVHDDKTLLGHRALVWIGDRSYSWYLWHLPFIVFAVALISDSRPVRLLAVAGSLAAAAASYHFVENPIRRSPRVRGRAVAALAAGCIAVAAAAALAAPPIAEALFPVASWKDVQSPHVDVQHGCNSPVPLGARPPAGCTWAHPGDRGTAVLIGDSNAGHFSEGVVGAAARERLRLKIATLSSCPFAAVVYKVEGWGPTRSNQCQVFFRRTLADMQRHPPRLVIMAALSTGYVEDPTVQIRPLNGGPFATTPQQKADVWQRGIASVVKDLTARGTHVLLLHQVPEFPSWPAVNCSIIRVALHHCPNYSVSRTTEDVRRSRAFKAEKAALATSPDAVGLSVDDELCRERRCYRADEHGRLLYSNATHLSPDGSRTLVDALATGIQSAL